jgi:hypothetical protein
MYDFNILNRADFSKHSFSKTVVCRAGDQTYNKIDFQPGELFCLLKVSWKYEVKTVTDNYGWPKAPLNISIQDAFTSETSSPQIFSPPKIIREKLEINIINPSPLEVVLHLKCFGTLVAPKANEILSDKEILGYVLLDDSQKGMLALSETIVDNLEERLGVDLRKSLPAGQAGSLESIPKLLQTGAVKALPGSDQNLQEKTDEDLKSLLIGDLVVAQTSLALDEITKLAEILIQKNWKK